MAFSSTSIEVKKGEDEEEDRGKRPNLEKMEKTKLKERKNQREQKMVIIWKHKLQKLREWWKGSAAALDADQFW